MQEPTQPALSNAGIVAHSIGGNVGAIALVTGVVGNCPLYSLLGVSTGAVKT